MIYYIYFCHSLLHNMNDDADVEQVAPLPGSGSLVSDRVETYRHFFKLSNKSFHHCSDSCCFRIECVLRYYDNWQPQAVILAVTQQLDLTDL